MVNLTSISRFLNNDKPAAILLFGALAIFLFVLLWNAIFHDPLYGYDAGEHFNNVRAYSQFRIPSSADTHEYWSPPLPYLLPALALGSGLTDDPGSRKFGQFINVALALLLSALLISAVRRAMPREPAAPALAMLLLAMLPVIYKSFATIRGEPYLAVLAIAIVGFYAHRFRNDGAFSARDALLAGLFLGLLALARQWGFMLFPAVAIFVIVEALRRKRGWRPVMHGVALAFFIAFLVGGWFYLVLWHRHGTPTPFAMARAESFRLGNQPASFYFDMSAANLFTDPVRPAFHNRLIPIFYSETWGDYWCYFLVWARNPHTGAIISGAGLEPQWYDSGGSLPSWMETNRAGMGRYLGRVNAAALMPSLILLFGFAMGARRWARWLAAENPSPADRVAALAFMAVVFSLAGYFYFLLMFPKHHEGDTIKATYMLQIFPLLALLAGLALSDWRARRPRIFSAVIVLLLLVMIHNLPACFSRFTF